MKTKILLSLLSVILIVSAYELNAQVSISAELRPRFEIRDGYKRLPDSTTTPAYLITQRSRLTGNYKSEKLNAKLTLQDVRTWGDEKLKDDVSTVGIYEAWAEFPLCDSMSLKIGRQEFIYDNERVLSNTNWQQKGLTHDAALLKYHSDGWKIDFAAAFNQTGDPYFGTNYPSIQGKYDIENSIKNNYKSMNFLFINKKFGDLNASCLALADGFQKRGTTNTMYMRETAGLILKYKIDDLNITLRGFYQMGKDTAGSEISAFYLNPELFWGTKTLMLNPGMEYVSGNDAEDSDNKKVNSFSTLYGTGHQFMGHMDYFTDIPKDTKKAGLVDIYLKTNYKLNEKTTLKVDYHYFMLQNNYVSGGETIDKALGHEIDVNLKYEISKEINLLTGYSLMKGTDSNVIVRGAGDSEKLGHWFFAMLTIKPNFYSSK